MYFYDLLTRSVVGQCVKTLSFSLLICFIKFISLGYFTLLSFKFFTRNFKGISFSIKVIFNNYRNV